MQIVIQTQTQSTSHLLYSGFLIDSPAGEDEQFKTDLEMASHSIVAPAIGVL